MDTSNKKNRREFLKTTGKAGLAAGLSATVLPVLASVQTKQFIASGGAEDVLYIQRPLPYAFKTLEPVIDAMTMEIHYMKHAAAYANNLADAVKAEGVDTEKEQLRFLLGRISKFSAKMRNNGGGHYNHEFFWKGMTSPVDSNSPSPDLLKDITRDFGSFEAFKTQFSDAAKNRFGSGWAWLVKTADKKLVVGSTPNQDNPLMDVSDLKGIPLLGLDVWEHAYYLKYQNRRPDYINAWWSTVNWKIIQQRNEIADMK